MKHKAVSLKTVCEVWRKYAEFRRGQIAESTYMRDYQKITRRLEKMRRAAPYLETSIEIRDWMLRHYSAESTRRSLVQIQAAMRWAMESGIIASNPFEGVARHIRPKKPSDKAWAAFTLEERDRIIAEFERTDAFYAPWTKFLFWTGCRPEEAAALQWADISHDCSEVLFKEAFPVDVKIRQTTKTGKTTRFPCNKRLQELLKSLQTQPLNRESYVFTGVEGGSFDYKNYQTRHWKPLVKRLVEEGKVAFYLSQYHARHTWITEALNHLQVADVSYLARVSPKVLYEHYAGRSRKIIIPEF